MTVSEGVYRIRNAKSGTYFDNSAKKPDVIHGWDERDGSKNQEWVVEKRGHDSYILKNVASGRYARAANGSNGTDVKASENASEWKIRDAGDDVYTIMLDGTDAVIDLDLGKKENGTAINVWDSTGARQQKWHFERVGGGSGGGGYGSGEGSSHGAGYGARPAGDRAPPRGGSYGGPFQPGRYALENVKTRTIIDLSGGSNSSGAAIICYTAGGQDNQKWDFENGTNGYIIKNAASGTYLSYDGDANEGTLLTGQSHPQEWVARQEDQGYVLSPAGTNLILDLAEQSGKICLWSDKGGANQRWNFIRL